MANAKAVVDFSQEPDGNLNGIATGIRNRMLVHCIIESETIVL